METYLQKIRQTPIIAILRGITPAEAAAVADGLVAAGIYFMEVTTDSEDWQTSLRNIKAKHGEHILIGAGTVRATGEVDEVKFSGGQAIISPHTDARVMKRANDHGLLAMPGCYTPTECFTALAAGADILKIFPVSSGGPAHIKHLATVLPAAAKLCPVGGVDADNMEDYLGAGAFAVGLGGALYQPGKSMDAICEDARKLVARAKKFAGE